MAEGLNLPTIDDSTAAILREPINAHAWGRMMGALSVNGDARQNARVWTAAAGILSGEAWAAFVTGWNIGKDAVLYGITPGPISGA